MSKKKIRKYDMAFYSMIIDYIIAIFAGCIFPYPWNFLIGLLFIWQAHCWLIAWYEKHTLKEVGN